MVAARIPTRFRKPPWNRIQWEYREDDAHRRQRVIGPKFEENLKVIRERLPVNLVFFTGDVAYHGREPQYNAATGPIRNWLELLEVPMECFFLVPGNHDVQRAVNEDSWEALREESYRQMEQHDRISRWMLDRDLDGFEGRWRTEVLQRQEAFWTWVDTGLGRGELLPHRNPHKRLGYRHELTLPGVPFPVQVVGLDTAWLAGRKREDPDKMPLRDTGQLRLTEHQVGRLATADGARLPGLRLGLQHHPLHELVDGEKCREYLAENLHIRFRGHKHKPQFRSIEEPGRADQSLATGCLYHCDKYVNGCELTTITCTDDGTPVKLETWFRSWSPMGGTWVNHDVYEGSAGGRKTFFDLTRVASGSPAVVID